MPTVKRIPDESNQIGIVEWNSKGKFIELRKLVLHINLVTAMVLLVRGWIHYIRKGWCDVTWWSLEVPIRPQGWLSMTGHLPTPSSLSLSFSLTHTERQTFTFHRSAHWSVGATHGPTLQLFFNLPTAQLNQSLGLFV